MGWLSFNQVMLGVGEPSTSQGRTVGNPSTTDTSEFSLGPLMLGGAEEKGQRFNRFYWLIGLLCAHDPPKHFFCVACRIQNGIVVNLTGKEPIEKGWSIKKNVECDWSAASTLISLTAAVIYSSKSLLFLLLLLRLPLWFLRLQLVALITTTKDANLCLNTMINCKMNSDWSFSKWWSEI